MANCEKRLQFDNFIRLSDFTHKLIFHKVKKASTRTSYYVSQQNAQNPTTLKGNYNQAVAFHIGTKALSAFFTITIQGDAMHCRGFTEENKKAPMRVSSKEFNIQQDKHQPVEQQTMPLPKHLLLQHKLLIVLSCHPLAKTQFLKALSPRRSI